MSANSYELIVTTNRDISRLYHFLGGYITGHVEEKKFFDGECSYDVEDVMSAYAMATSDIYPDFLWWHESTCFKGKNNSEPYSLTSSINSFYDKNFPDIIFSISDSDQTVRNIIKEQFFKKFNKIVDPIDNSTLINEVKVLIDSNVFTEHFTKSYCQSILEEYENHEKMFSGYVIDKVNFIPEQLGKNAITFYLKYEPTKEIVNNMINRIHYFIEHYEELMILTDMHEHCHFSDTISEVIEDPFNFKVLFVDIVEHVTISKSKRIVHQPIK